MVVSANLKLVRLSQVAGVPALEVLARRTSIRVARDVAETWNCEDVAIAASCVRRRDAQALRAQSFSGHKRCCSPEESPGVDYFESLMKSGNKGSGGFRLRCVQMRPQ